MINVIAQYQILEALVENFYDKIHKNLEENRLRLVIMLASGMQLTADMKHTMDPACWYDWLEAIDGKKTPCTLLEFKDGSSCYQAVDGERERSLPYKELTLKEGYDAAIRFLTKYANRLESKDIKAFIKQLSFEQWSEMAHKMFPDL